jgi:putative tryptophan/tyrosine transport system substrate-binding protein
MRRREFIMFVGGVGAWPFASYAAMAHPSDRVRQIAMLSGFSATDPEAQARIAVLQEGLKELGWIEGANLGIEFRWGTGGAEQMRAAARQLVNLKPDLFLA